MYAIHSALEDISTLSYIRTVATAIHVYTSMYFYNSLSHVYGQLHNRLWLHWDICMARVQCEELSQRRNAYTLHT